MDRNMRCLNNKLWLMGAFPRDLVVSPRAISRIHIQNKFYYLALITQRQAVICAISPLN